jgi:hypothetical protein
MDDCLVAARGRLRAFFDFARFGRALEGSRDWAGDKGPLIAGFVGDLTDLADLTDPWLRRCDFLRTGGDTGDRSLGLGNLSSSRSDSFALLIESSGGAIPAILGMRSWIF